MIFHITHQIRYDYPAPVFLEPHIIRLRPRTCSSLQLKNFSLAVLPQPSGQHDFLDAEGNAATCAWFNGKVDSLLLTTSCEIQSSYSNPFNYFVTDKNFLELPVLYSGDNALVLAPCLEDIESSQNIKMFVSPLVKEARGVTLDFLTLLNSKLQKEFLVESRKEGLPLPPDVTLQKKRGACRDLAVLFIAACRSVGLAARFVSGYHVGARDMSRRDLHAWGEVYIPAGGWQGYDPTLGLVNHGDHIPLAASCIPSGAAPVTGSYRGTGIPATMSYAIEIETKEI